MYNILFLVVFSAYILQFIWSTILGIIPFDSYDYLPQIVYVFPDLF